MKIGSPYIALYGPEARREDIERMFGCLPRMIGNCEIQGMVLSFANRRGDRGTVPTIIPGDGVTDAMIFHCEYYQQRRLERRLWYPMGIQRGTFDSIVEGKHPCRVMTYYVPLIRPRGEPDEALVRKMEELYRENAWDARRLETAIETSKTSKEPVIRRIK